MLDRGTRFRLVHGRKNGENLQIGARCCVTRIDMSRVDVRELTCSVLPWKRNNLSAYRSNVAVMHGTIDFL